MVALSLIAASLGAQEPAPGAPLVLPGTQTEVVYVDVFVSDKDGRPVPGLSAADFEVLEDGRPVSVVNFSGGPGAPLPGEPTVAVPDVAPRAARELRPEERTHVVVYVDNAHLHAVDRQRVLARLQAFFVGERPGQRVMVASHGSSVKVLTPFTEDFSAVRGALERATREGSDVARDELEHRVLVTRIERGAADDAQALLFEVRSYAQDSVRRLQASLAALRSLLNQLGGLPGRKVLLYVSSGLAQRPGQDLLQMLANKYGEGSLGTFAPDGADQGGPGSLFSLYTDLEQGPEFKSLLNVANANRVTLYAIDGAMARASFSVSAEEAGAGALGDVRVSDAFAQTLAVADKSGSLAYLAEYTGGRRLPGNQKLDQRLADLAGDLESGYALAYAPPQGADGKYHTISVKARRAGLKVRHRVGYRSKTTDERVADVAWSSLLGQTDNPLELTLEAGAPKPDGRGTFGLPVVVKLPVGRLSLTRQGEEEVGRLTLYFVVQDEQGGVSEPQKREVPLRFPAGRVQAGSKQVMGYPITLQVKPGRYVVGVGLRDDLADRRAGASLRVDVNQPPR